MRQRTSMFISRRGLGLVSAALVVALAGVAMPVAAQDGPPDRQRGNRQRFEDMSDEEREAFRERMMERLAEREAEMLEDLREEMGAGEDDFAVLSPMIVRVQSLQRERDTLAAAARFGGRGGPGGRGQGRGGGRGFGGPGGFAMFDMSEHAQSWQDARAGLEEALEDDDAAAETLHEKIKALRAARAAHESELASAQKELREVLVARQEAVLILRGMLD